MADLCCVQVEADGKWTTIVRESRAYCLGYMEAYTSSPSPRFAVRVTKSSGAVIDARPAATEVGVGMVAGWPTAAQYDAAAKRAMETAAIIRAREAARQHP